MVTVNSAQILNILVGFGVVLIGIGACCENRNRGIWSHGRQLILLHHKSTQNAS